MWYVKQLVVPDFRARDLEAMCTQADSSTKKGVEFDEEVTFVDGRRLAIQVIGCGDEEPAWTQGVLFAANGQELGHTDVGESFLGEYEVSHGGDTYMVAVVSTAELEENSIWPMWYNEPLQMCRLIGELAAVGGFTEQVVKDLSEEMDLSEHLVTRLIERGQGRWDEVKYQFARGGPEGLRSSEVLQQAAELAGWSTPAAVSAICAFIDACGLTDQLDGYLSSRAGLDRAAEQEGQSCG